MCYKFRINLTYRYSRGIDWCKGVLNGLKGFYGNITGVLEEYSSSFVSDDDSFVTGLLQY